jgi:hypothetical protein
VVSLPTKTPTNGDRVKKVGVPVQGTGHSFECLIHPAIIENTTGGINFTHKKTAIKRRFTRLVLLDANPAPPILATGDNASAVAGTLQGVCNIYFLVALAVRWRVGVAAVQSVVFVQ